MPEPGSPTPGRRSWPWGDLWLAVAILALTDLLLFHGGLYHRVLAPESYSGTLERQMRRLLAHHRRLPDHEVVLLTGNSKGVHGFDERQLETMLGHDSTPVIAVNISVPGSSARTWNLQLNDPALRSLKLRTVVLGLDLEQLKLAGPTSQRRDLDIVKTRLSIRTVWQAAAWHTSLEDRLGVAAAGIFRGLLYRADLDDLVRSPAERYRRLRVWKKLEHSEAVRRRRFKPKADVRLPEARLEGERAVFSQMPDWLRRDSKLQRDITIRLRLQRRDLEEGTPRRAPAPTHLRHLRTIVESINDRGADVVLAVVPRYPWPDRCRSIRPVHRFVAHLRSQGRRVRLYYDPDRLDLLEQPAFFRDLMHVNLPGAEVFTSGLGQYLQGSRVPPGSTR